MDLKPHFLSLACFLSSLSQTTAAPSDVDSIFLTNLGAGITGASHPDNFPTGAQNAVAVQPGGKIIVGGARSRFNNVGELTVLKRLNADGTLDPAFLPGVDYESGPQVLSGGDAEINAILMNPDGSFFIGGVFENYGTAGTARMCVARVNADGTLDEGFVPPASISTAGGRYVLALSFAPNGDLLVGGRFGVNLYRLNPATGAQVSITNSVSGTGTTVSDVRAGPDGRLYVSGAASGGLPMVRRLFLDGSLDPSFQVQFQPGEFGNVNKILPLPDGRVVLGGGFLLAGSTQDDRLACVLSDGRVDTIFRTNRGTGPNGWAGGVLQLLPTGEILTGGVFSNFNGTDTASLAVLGLDGTFNPVFAPVPYTTAQGSYGTHLYSVAVQDDGRLLAAGWFNRVTDPARDIRNLVRFEGLAQIGNGEFSMPATTYNVVENAGQVSIQVFRLPGVNGAVTVDYATRNLTALAGTDYTATSGTLSWAAGEGGAKTLSVPVLNNSSVDATTRRFAFELSNPTGGAILGAQSNAEVILLDDEGAPVITQQPQNTTVIQGQGFTLTVNYTVNRSASVSWQRFNGTAFEPFPGGNTPSITVTGADPATHGGQWRAVISHATGSATSNAVTVTVLTPDGSLVPGFNSSAPAGTVNFAQEASGGKILMIGVDPGFSLNQLRRLNADGTLDGGFTVSNLSNAPSGMVLLPDGRIMVAGFFTTVTSPFNGGPTPRAVLARFNADGTLDTGYTPSLPANAGTSVFGAAMSAGSGGKFYTGFTGGGGLRRYNADGSLDAGFTAAAGLAAGSGGEVTAVREAADGKVYVAHRISTPSTTYNLWRLNADGTRDTSFADPGANNNINTLEFLPDGRIAVGGQFLGFSTISPTPMVRVALLAADGQVDLGFRSAAPNAIVRRILSRDGRLMIAGEFTGFTNPALTLGRVARLNLDGTVDSSFFTGTGAGNAIHAMFFTSDGALVVAGSFTTFNGVNRNRMARLLYDGSMGAVGFDPARVTVTEAARTLQLTVKRYGPATQAASVDWSTQAIATGGADTPATPGSDYTNASGTLSWAAGDSADKTVTLTLLDDSDVEPTEVFRVVLSNPTGPVATAANATISLLDSDTPVTFTTQPAGTTLVAGGTLSLTAVVSSPTPVSLRWLRNGVATSFTTAALSLPNITLADAGVYVLEATNAAGIFQSQSALVVVSQAPSVITSGWPLNLVINGAVRAIVPTADGGAYVGGDFTNFNGSTGYSYLVKISSTGVLDTTFAPAPNSPVSALALGGDKLFVLGTFTQVGGGAALNNKFAALDPATGARVGAFMTALGAGAESFKEIRCLAVLSDGDLLLGGDFTFFNSSGNHKYLARINPDGTLDAGFNTSAATGTAALVVTAVGAMPTGGGFYAGGTIGLSGGSRFIKFNADGSRDAAFAPSGMGTGTSFTRIRVLADGRVMATGTNLPPSNRSFTRLAADGSWSSTEFFGSTSGSFTDFVLLSTGRSIGVGSFVFVRNPSTLGNTSNIASFNATGNYDGTWPTGAGLGGVAHAAALSAMGEVWIGGEFTTYNTTSVQRLLRLAGEPADPAIVNPPVRTDVNGGATARFSVGAVGTSLSYQWLKNGTPLSDGGNVSGATTAILTLSNVTTADDALYSVEVTGGSPASTVTSAQVKLNVMGAPVVLASPAIGSPARGSTLTLAADVLAATPATYAWTRNGVPIINGGRYSGATTATLVIQNINIADNGSYVLTVTNGLGSASTTAAVLALTQNATDRDPATTALVISGTGSTSVVNDVMHLPDGRVLLAVNGTFLGASSTSTNANLVLVNTDGTVAATAAGSFNGSVTRLFRMPEGRILVLGNFTSVNSATRNRVARLNADLTLDTTFTPVGVTAGSLPFLWAAPDHAGRTYLVGSFTNYGGLGYNYIVRLNADGSLDTSYNLLLNGTANQILPLSGGGFMLAGPFTTFGPSSTVVMGLMRLNAEGARDSSFTAASFPAGSSTRSVRQIAIDSQGRIVVTGDGFVSPSFVNYIVRLLPNGSLDGSFSFTGALSLPVERLVIQPGDKVLVAGSFTTPTNRIFRLNSDGGMDSSFNVGTGFNAGTVNTVVPDATGRLWIGGGFASFNGVSANRLIVMLGEGSPGVFFTQLPASQVRDLGGTAVFTAAAAAANGFTFQWRKGGTPLADGARFSGTTTSTLTLTGLLASDAGAYDVVVSSPSGPSTSTSITSPAAQLTVLTTPEILSHPTARTVDLGATVTFTGSARGAGTLSYQWLHFDTPLTNGGVVSGATTPTLTLTGVAFANAGDYRLRVTNSLGQDTSNAANLTVQRRPGALASGLSSTTANGSVLAILRLADGSMLVGGQITGITVNGVTTSRSRLARFLPDGTLDTSFNPTIPATVRAIAQDSAGRVFIAGDFNGSLTIGGVTATRNRVARLTSALVLDTAFDTSTTGPNANINAIAPTENGGVYIGGVLGFNQVGTTAVNRIARLNASGALDTSFSAAASVNNEVFCLLRRSDGKLYAGGTFGTQLLNANGTRDTAFSPESPTILGVLGQAMLQLSDGSLILAGNGTSPQNYLRRLNANTGAGLANFTTGHSSVVNALALQADGRLLSGSSGVLKRTNTTTAADDGGFGAFNDRVLALAVDNAGRIWAGGSFNQYGGVAQTNLAILNGGDFESRDGLLTPQTITFAAPADRTFNPAANSFTITAPTSSSGLPVTVAVTSGPATISGNTVTITGAGSVTLTASQAGNSTFAPASLSRTFTVAKASQAITFAALINRGSTSPPFTVAATSSSGLPVSFRVVSGPATVTGSTVALSGTLGTVVLEASQPGDANWNPATPVERSFEVTVPGRPQTITFAALADRVFNPAATSFTVNATASSGLPVTFTVSGPATISGKILTITGAGLITVTAVQVGNSTFSPASLERSFTVSKAAQAITFGPLGSRPQDAGSFALTATASSGLPVVFSILGGPATVSGNVLTLTGGLGTVRVLASQPGNDAWSAATPVEQAFNVVDSLPVVRQAQAITFNPPASLFLAETGHPLSAFASSDLPVTLTLVSGPAGTTLTGGTLAFITAGTVRIRATQAGNAAFLAAPAVEKTITLRANPTTLTLVDLVQVYNGQQRPISVVGNIGSVVITYGTTNSPNPPTNAGSYPVKAVAGGVTKTGTLVISKAPLRVIPDDQRKLAGRPNPTLTFQYDGFVGSDSAASAVSRAPTLSTTASATSPAGNYPITATGGTSANYAFVHVKGNLQVESFAGQYETLLVNPTTTRPEGRLEITIPAASTSFSGRLFLTSDAAPVSISGPLVINAMAETATLSFSVTKGATNPVKITHAVSFSTGLAGSGLAASATRSVGVPTTSSATWTAVKPRLLPAYSGTPPVTYAGAHTILLGPPQPTAATALPLPLGHGFATAAIDSKGVMNLTGKLADGTTLTASLRADEEAAYRLYAQPYAGRADSHATGWLELKAHPSLSGRGIIRAIDAQALLWKKAPRSTDPSYRLGLPESSCGILLDPWLPPVAGTSLTAIPLRARIGLDTTTGSLRVLHSGLPGSLTTTSLPGQLLMSATGAVSLTNPAPSANPRGWRATITPGTGAFTGSFTVLDGAISRLVSFSGVMRQPPGTEAAPALRGAGHGLLPQVTGQAAPGGSTSNLVEFRRGGGD